MISDLIALVLVLVVGGFAIRKGLSFRNGEGAGSSHAIGRGSALAAGVVSVVALVQIQGPAQLAPGVVALGLGLAAAIMPHGPWASAVVGWGLSAVGAIASVSAVADILDGGACAGVGGTVVHVAGLGLLAAFAVFAYFFAASGRAAFGKGLSLNPLTGVAYFGAIEILGFLQAPGGMFFLDLGVGAILTVLLVALLLGAAIAFYPELTIAAAGASIALSQFSISQVGLACAPGPDLLEAGGSLVVFLVGFVAMTYLSRFVGRR